jgi:hypothetical protein
VIKIVRVVSELMLYGESKDNKQMFKFFGEKNILVTFLELVRTHTWLEAIRRTYHRCMHGIQTINHHRDDDLTNPM